MKTLAIELRKGKRTGVIPVLLAVGVLGAAYAFVNFIVRKDTLLNLPLAPMDVLLTQLYGMIMVLNLFGIVVATCMIYNMEFKGSAVKKMYMLPVSVPAMYLCKFLILTVMFLVAIVLQNLALAQIGMTDLPDGAFEMGTLVRFAGYSFLTSMPVLSFMLLISSRFENMWVPLGIGVAGFLSGMALANSGLTLLRPNEVLADKFKSHNWFLPSEGELARIAWYYMNGVAGGEHGIFKNAIADGIMKDFGASWFGSSSEFNSVNEWIVHFGSGNCNNTNKNNSNVSRAVVALDEQVLVGWITAFEDCCLHKKSSVDCTMYRLDSTFDLVILAAQVEILRDYSPGTSICRR